MTPQRLHAELLVTSASRLQAYLQGALKDATMSALHRTHRYGQSDKSWLETLELMLGVLGHRSWIYARVETETSGSWKPRHVSSP